MVASIKLEKRNKSKAFGPAGYIFFFSEMHMPKHDLAEE